MVRITRLTCDSTRALSSFESVMIDSAPTRSPYREKDLENELETKKSRPDSANRRTAAASSAMPSPKPW
ncbi:hypothetical protein D3C80_1462710 [compost metagenome]